MQNDSILQELNFLKAEISRLTETIVKNTIPTKTETYPPYLTIDETCKILRVCPNTLQKLRLKGEVRCIQKGRRILFPSNQFKHLTNI